MTRSRTRAAILAVASGLVLAVAVVPAAAQQQDEPAEPTTGFFAPADSELLSKQLQDATDSQGVCYGWDVTASGGSVTTPVREMGSNAGPAVPVQGLTGCDAWVEFQATITYTSESSESEDSAAATVQSSLPAAPTTAQIEALGIKMADLVTDRDAETIFNATMVLPLLVAENGAAAPVALGQNSDEPTDAAGPAPGSDFTRSYGLALVIFAAMAGIGLIALLLSFVFRRRKAEDRGQRPGTGAQLPAAQAPPASGGDPRQQWSDQAAPPQAPYPQELPPQYPQPSASPQEPPPPPPPPSPPS